MERHSPRETIIVRKHGEELALIAQEIGAEVMRGPVQSSKQLTRE